MKGFFLIDKPKGVTSFDIVRQVRRLTGEKRVGHAGTLDPLATGLLLVATGEGTKLLEYFVGLDKEYEVTAKFGYVSDTYDADGKITKIDMLGKGNEIDVKFSKKNIGKIIEENFLGEINQMPPAYSAIKIGGKKAYEIARKGDIPNLTTRKIRIDDYKIVEFSWPFVKFKVSCSSGTYIRSLIYDLGQKLGCGAYVEELRRIKIGDFSLDKAIKIKLSAVAERNLNKKVEQKLMKALISLEEVVSKFVILQITDEEFTALSHGRNLKNKKIEQNKVNVAFYKGKLVGILEQAEEGGIKFRKRIL